MPARAGACRRAARPVRAPARAHPANPSRRHPAMNQYELLNAARVTGLMQGLQDPRLQQQPLIWNERIPDVPAVDDEIVAYYQGTPVIADLVADDAAAVIYTTGRFSFESVKIPNIKMGIGINQSMLQMMNRLSRNALLRGELDILSNMQARHVANVLYGVNLRKEVLKLAMLLDGYSYDRLGIKLNNVTWGMPSDLKITTGIAWTSTSATPITDIQTARRIARVRYGIELNRATMTTAALQFAAATTEFINQAKLLGWGLLSTPVPVIPIQNDTQIRQIFERVLGGGEGGAFTIEIDDRRYWAQDTAGATTSQPFQPINAVLLTSTANDRNGVAYDFANGDTAEGMVAGAAPVNVIGGSIPQGPGPVGYVTAADPTLNPPGLVTWGVARGFPRKYSKPASAVLNVGNITEVITVGVPFPI
jgi:hypothetical protein